jgi:ribose transport system substrate-binding protein
MLTRTSLQRGAATTAVLAACLLAAACGSSSSSSTAGSSSGTANASSSAANTSSAAASATAGKITIGVMIKDTTQPFWQPVQVGYRKMAAKYGWHLQIRNGNGDPATEVAIVQQFIAEKVNMIMVSPDTPTGLVPVIDQANAAGIPVIVVNSAVAKGAKIVSFVGASDLQYGQALGHAVISALGSTGGNIAVIRGKPGDSPDTLREQGLMQVLATDSKIHVLTQQPANWQNALALSVTQNYLNKYPGTQLGAIVDFGPEGVTGAQYAQKLGRQVKFIVGDYPVQVRNAIQSGAVYAAVDQDPETQSITAMQLANKYLNGNKSAVPPIDYLPLPVVTKTNVAGYPARWND